MSEARVLVVDDDSAVLRTVQRILAADYDVRAASAPEEALEIARTLEPHVAVLDIRMPGLDGFELMNRLKALDAHIQVVLMTGSVYQMDAQLIRAIREKAFYYIHKPFDRELLRTLVQRAVEHRFLEDENRRHLGHLESQLAEARSFQQTMLPPRQARLAGFEIHAAYRPSAELAGDLYDYAEDGEGGIALLVADVVGHGASAAMLTAIVKSAFRSSYPERYDPLAVVRRVADAVLSFEADRFVTLIAARIARNEPVLEYVSAGHDGGLIARPGQDAVQLASTGPIVSPVLSFLGWQKRRVECAPDAVVLLYTDGVSDATDGAESFGAERIRRIARSCEAGPTGLVDQVLRELDAFVHGRPANDDRTLLAVGTASRTGVAVPG